MKSFSLKCACVLLAFGGALLVATNGLRASFAAMRHAEAQNDAASEILFIRRIAPLLQTKCLACHGQDEKQIKGRLDLRSRAGLLKGGASGQPALVPGQLQASSLYLAVTRAASGDWSPMPPKEADQLNAEQIGWLRQWIAAGAPWPDAARTRELTVAHAEQWAAEDGLAVKTSDGLSPEWTHRKYKPEGLWAYQPVKKFSAAEIRKLPFANRNPIDAFLAARLPAGLQPAPLADRATLIRRATFDLTGLPPSPEEVAAFLRDSLPDEQAFAKVLKRLLDSPHYGESLRFMIFMRRCCTCLGWITNV